MRRWILISALILLAVLGAAWWFLPSLVQLVALHYAPDLGLRGVVLDLEKIGTNQARAKRLQLTMDTSNGPVTVKLNDVTARYDLVGLNIEELHAASGQAIWRQEFTTAADDAPIVLPPLPPGRLRVDHLQVSLLTPLASLAVPGRLEVRTDPRQGITMTLQGDSEKITVKLPSDAASLELQAADLSGLSMLAADISDPLGNHTKVDLRTDLVRLHAWLPRRLQTDRIVLDHISAASLHSGHINMQIVYDPKARNWTLPDIRIAWESLNALDILTTTKIHAAALPDKDGWLLRVLDTSPFTLSGPGLPVREAQLELAPGASISVTADGTAQGRGPVVLRVRSADKRLAGNLDEWRIASDRAAFLQLSNLAAEPYAIAADKLTINTSSTEGNPLAGGKVKLLGLRTRGKKKGPTADSPLDADATWHWRDNKITAAGKMSLDGRPIVHIQARSGPTTAKGSAEVSLDVDAGKVSVLLKGMHTWLDSLVVRAGKMRGDTKINWTERGIKGTAKLQLSGLDADILAAQVRGADMSVSVKDMHQPVYQFSVAVPKAQPANDMEIKDIRVNGSWQGDVINIAEADFKALGGWFRLPNQSLDFSQDRRLTIGVKGLELSEIFRLANVNGLNGEGRLSGELPILFYTGGIEVPDSSLVADGPGFIGYDSGTGTNPQLDNIALQALKNFRYETMNASVIYKRNGDYAIKARIVGRNPDVYGGTLLALNINLTANLPGILRASLLTGDFDKEVLRQVQMESKARKQGADPGRTKENLNGSDLPKHPVPRLQ